MTSIFISYRRDDSQDVTGRVYERLTSRFGTGAVFKDVDSIPLGADFRDTIAQSVSNCDVVLAIIGNRWLESTSPDGNRRLDDKSDYVLVEIEAAISAGKRIIPVLVGGADVPSEDCLPPSIRELAYCNAAQVRADPDFNIDIERLIDGISQQDAPDSEHPERRTRPQVILLVHGIRTQAEWQGMVRNLLQSGSDQKVVPIKYGYFDVFRFWCPILTRNKPIAELVWKIENAIADDLDAELIVIAHSFGTYAVSEILREKPNIRPDRMILCGGIVPRSFRWDKLPNCPETINECGSRDIWPIFAASTTWGYGASGTFGFGSPGIHDRSHDIRHSDYFTQEFVQKFWKPFVDDATYAPSAYEDTQPAAPWWRSVLSVLPLRWCILAIVIALLWIAFRYIVTPVALALLVSMGLITPAREVPFLAEPDYSSFELIEDTRQVDLRQWKPVAPVDARKRVSPVIWRRQIRLTKTNSADEIRFQFGTTSLLELDLKCTNLEEKYYYVQKSRKAGYKLDEVTNIYHLVVDVANFEVGENFILEIEAVFWNTFQKGDSRAAISVKAPMKKVSLLVLFPDDYPIAELDSYCYLIKTKEKIQCPHQLIVGRDNSSAYFEINNPPIGTAHRIMWQWVNPDIQ